MMKNNSGVPNLSPNQLNMLLNVASQKLGVTPQQLQQQLQSGQLPGGIDAASVNNLLNDPKKRDALLHSEQAQQMLRNLLNGAR